MSTPRSKADRPLPRDLVLDTCGERQLMRLLTEAGQERPGDRSWCTATDLAIIDFHDRDDLARRARQEGLIGAEEVFVVQDGLPNRDSLRGSNLEQERARDAWKESRIDGRRERDAVPDDEQIREGAFRQLAAV